MAHILGAEALHLEFPTKVIFDSVTIGIEEGDRIGIVGRNGDGKSTLMQLLAGRLEPHGGRVTIRSGTTLGMLHQSDDIDADVTVKRAIVGNLDDHEWAGDAKIRDVLTGLIADIDLEAMVSTLSGGQRRRVALAALLVGDWDVVFLDEPTNHLDVEGITWLAQHIKRRWARNSGALVVVTHDRWFLDEVCTATWEVHDRLVEPFEGGYAAYVLQRVERDRMAASSEAKRQNLMRKELAWLRRGAPARTSKPKFRIDAANQLIENEPPIRDSVQLSQMATARLGKDVVDILNVSVSYGDKQVLDDVEWRIAPGERTGVLGVNGAGKSTLLNLVLGTVQPTTGRVKRGKTVKIAALTQHLDELKDIENDRISEVIARKRTTYETGGKDMSPAQMLERLGFTGSQLYTPIKNLSGGQRRRLQLLLILLDEPNVLILDEPSNDLDTDMLAAMEDLLDTWPGTLLVVSHDRYLLERVTDQQYAVLDGKFTHLPGGIDQYLGIISQTLASAKSSTVGSRAASVSAAATATAAATAAASVSASAVASAAASTAGVDASRSTDPTDFAQPSGAALHAANKELSAIDRKLTKLAEQTKKLHAQMLTHDPNDFGGLSELSSKQSSIEDEIADLEEKWMQLSEQLEG